MRDPYSARDTAVLRASERNPSFAPSHAGLPPYDNKVSLVFASHRRPEPRSHAVQHAPWRRGAAISLSSTNDRHGSTDADQRTVMPTSGVQTLPPVYTCY